MVFFQIKPLGKSQIAQMIVFSSGGKYLSIMSCQKSQTKIHSDKSVFYKINLQLQFSLAKII